MAEERVKVVDFGGGHTRQSRHLTSHHSRHSRHAGSWIKMFDPNKEKNDNRVPEKDPGSGLEAKSDEKLDPGQHRCCGGNPCKAAQRRTLDEFGKEMSALTEADMDERNQNRNLANKYKLPLSLIENLREVFNKFDEDKDGTVSGKEILDVFQTLGAVFTRQQCDDVIKSFLGGSISGEIDFDEMIKMFAHRKSNAKDYQQDLELAFRMFDLDGDGYVCAEDLKQVMKMLGNDLSDEEIRTIYSHLDTDDNGLIDFKEFESILYPDVRAQPILLKKKRKRSPHLPKQQQRKTMTKKSNPKQGILGFDTVKHVQSGGSGIYNAFYTEHGANYSYRQGSSTSSQNHNSSRTRFLLYPDSKSQGQRGKSKTRRTSSKMKIGL